MQYLYPFDGRVVNMLAIRLLPVVLSCWVFAAHFLRVGAMVPFALLALCPLVLVVRHRAIPLVMSGLLLVIALGWLLITYDMVTMRMMMEADWMRMAAIMTGVVCFTLASTCCFQTQSAQRFYAKHVVPK